MATPKSVTTDILQPMNRFSHIALTKIQSEPNTSRSARKGIAIALPGIKTMIASTAANHLSSFFRTVYRFGSKGLSWFGILAPITHFIPKLSRRLQRLADAYEFILKQRVDERSCCRA